MCLSGNNKPSNYSLWVHVFLQEKCDFHSYNQIISSFQQSQRNSSFIQTEDRSCFLHLSHVVIDHQLSVSSHWFRPLSQENSSWFHSFSLIVSCLSSCFLCFSGCVLPPGLMGLAVFSEEHRAFCFLLQTLVRVTESWSTETTTTSFTLTFLQNSHEAVDLQKQSQTLTSLWDWATLT